MASKVYECLFLLDSNKYARDAAGITGSIDAMVAKLDGEMLASRLWDERKLAYPVKGQRKGTYWLTYFRMDSVRLAEFDREVRLNTQINRHLVLKVDPRLVDALVAHARGEAVPEEAPVEVAATEGEGETSSS